MGQLGKAISVITGAFGLHGKPCQVLHGHRGFDEPPTLLAKAKIHEVLYRGVPVNRFEPGPTTQAARVVFADGSIALVRSIPPGRLVEVALACHRSRVIAHLTEPSRDGDIVFTWSGGQIAAELVGPDQPD